MIKPLSAIVTAIGMFAALTLTATPAVAAGSCSIVVPRTVSIDRPYKLISATLGSDCVASGGTYASWVVRHSWYGPGNIFIFDGTNSDGDGFYEWEHTGTYYVEPSSSWDANYNRLTQNTTAYVVKYATWTYVVSSRRGRAVYINGLVHQWTPSDLGSGSGRQVYLQRYIGGKWQNIAVRTANARGQFVLGFIQTKVYQYRLVTTETSSAWSGASVSTFR